MSRRDRSRPGRSGEAPFASLVGTQRRLLYGAAAGAFIGVGIPLLRAEQQMRATGGPGIVAFELVGPDRVDSLLEKWGDKGCAAARTSLRLDQLWLNTYAVLLAGASTAAAERLGRSGRDSLARVAGVAGWAALAAGACDAVENASLLTALRSERRRHTFARVAKAAATTKFALLGLPVAAVVTGAVAGS